ncbi:MAG: DNA-binding response regulator [Caldilineae bacterium]|nr:MAG: DNA-binding response regulator [Caldilineae bacterium]
MNRPAPIRLLLADDHAVMRSGLRLLLDAQPDMETVGEAENGFQALTLAKQLNPDVVLLDLTMPGVSGLRILSELQRLLPQPRVLILTMHADEGYLREALRLGADGYVVKSAADQELLTAIRAVMRGEVYVHPSLTRTLLQDILPAPEPGADPWDLLSQREQQVIRRVARGFTNREIADALHLSVKTVETYRARAMEKLGFGSRAELVAYAARRGLLEADQPGSP